MKITGFRLKELTGTMNHPGTFFEERRGQPTDIYPEFKTEGTGEVSGAIDLGNGKYKIVRSFLFIDTDEGVTGIAGPYGGKAVSVYLETQIKPLLMGRNPLATEFLWDIMYRNAVQGRKGDNMTAICFADIALWDIRGKWSKQPVCNLLGGPVQQKIPAYCSDLRLLAGTGRSEPPGKGNQGEGLRRYKVVHAHGPDRRTRRDKKECRHRKGHPGRRRRRYENNDGRMELLGRALHAENCRAHAGVQHRLD